MADLLDKLEIEKKQSENKELKIDKTHIEKVNELTKIISQALEKRRLPGSLGPRKTHDYYCDLIRDSNIIYSQEEINYFLQWLKHNNKFLDKGLGLIISALTNNVSQNEVYLQFDLLCNDINYDYIGTANCKKLIVYGNVGDYFGLANESNITLHGNAGFSIGASAKKSSEFYLNGNFQTIDAYIEGNVYHNQELVIKNGLQVNPKKWDYNIYMIDGEYALKK